MKEVSNPKLPWSRSPGETLPYRPEIDGLRGCAVLAVVLCHAGLGVPGGYVGVDVFFVISGYLISSLIIKEFAAKRFSLVHFWERRARRIIPAVVVVILATLLAGWFLLLPRDYLALARSAGAQVIFAANFYYRSTIDYFSGPADELPLLHTWSLSVEEQFYLLFPLLLLGLFRLRAVQRPSVLLGIFGAGLLASFVVSIIELPQYPISAFYLLPARAWELLAGACLTVAPPSWMRPRRVFREIVSWVGAAAILLPCFVYTKQTPFPGVTAFPPCIGTALILFANSTTTPGEGMTWIGRLLSLRPLVYVGLVSYSFYLWHWPLLAFATYATFTPLSLVCRLGLVIAAFLMAIVSCSLVELPFRRRRIGSGRKSMFAYAAGGLVTVGACAAVIVGAAGFPTRLTQPALAFANAGDDRLFTVSVSLDDARAGRFVGVGDTRPGAPTKVIVWGDSHAMDIVPAVDAICRESGVRGEAATYKETAPVLDYQQASDFGLGGNEALAFNQAVLDHIVREHIPNVVLAARWSGYFEAEIEDDPDAAGKIATHDDDFSKALCATVRRLRAGGARVWVFEEVPEQPVNVPKALACAVMYVRDSIPTATLESHARKTAAMRGLAPDLQAAGAELLDPAPLFFRAPNGRCLVADGSASLYSDAHHLSTAGAFFVKNLFQPAVR